ncbi:hypothetical protein HK100_009956 [Physocladia obscura]|uniref:Methyltransferase domain-containing protein n=1 Tax=Physocladia obscura TaxID=109957 RepID=A0AAD5T9T6_9FUNG|nr:hypothetical protein HK100_009956 [Physocladia obscura]
MGPHQSKVFKKYLDGSSHTDQTSESSVYSSSLNATPKSASVTELAKTEVDKLQAKVWNPNSPDSWKADIRGYHSVQSSNYPLPSDEIEQNRLEVQHYILRVAFEGDIICPEAKELVQFDGTKVLDVGCAKGFWLESVQKENPFGEYHGVDIAENLAAEKGTINIKFGNVLERLPCEY